MKKVLKKFLSAFLVTVMVIQILPLTVFASEYQNDLLLQSPVDSETSYDDLTIEEEVVEERDAFSKTYLLENGVYCTLTSSTAIHKESDDEWIEINPSNNTPETINDASIALSSLSDDNSNISSEPTLNDGLIVNDNANQLDIYGAELTEDDNGDYFWNITNGNGSISEFSNVLVKPVVTNSALSYNKTQVTVDAAIKLTCNTQLSDLSYDTYIQAFKDKWTEDGFSPNELLEINDDFDFINVSKQIYDYNTVDEAGNYVWNITSIYNKWENGSETNNGLIIHTDGTENIYITSGILMRYYRVIDKNDNGFTYHYEDMGRAGTLCVNDFTNVPILQRNELSIDGIKMPVSLTRYITNGLSDDSFGAGGKWNYSSELTYSNNTFMWNTIDGSSKRFQKSSDNETDDNGREKWVEYLYNGGECVLWVKPSSLYNLPYDFSQNIIIDEEENIYQFNSSNKLISITSKDNTSLNINYGNGDKIVNITDGVGRKYVFDNSGFTAPYNTVKKVSVLDTNDSPITYDNENPIDIDYTYTICNNKVCLSSATYPDNKTVYYEYDNYGRLITVKNIDNSKLDIEYYNSDASKNLNPIYFSRIKSYTKSVYDAENETYIIQNKVEFNADDTYRRTIKTTKNIKTITEISQYNSNLDLLYLIDSDGNDFYADYNNTHTLQSFTNNSKSVSENLVANGDMSQKKIGGGPKNWNTINLNKTSCLMPKRNDDFCVEFVNSIDQTRGLYQDVSIDGKKDDKYVISAWGKAASTIPKDSRFWGVRILAQNESGNEEIIHEMGFDTSLWDIEQIRKTAFALPFDTNKLTVQLISCNQLYNVQFDDIELYKAEDSYVASVDDSKDTTSCTCSNCTETNCPCKCTNENDCECIYCKRGINISYDEKGNEITTTTDGVISMVSKKGFSSTGNYLAKTVDENGIKTYYKYDENTGTLSSIATGNETDKINYTYTAVGLLKTVSQTVTNIVTGEKVNMLSEYTYNGDNLTQINHNGSVYSFEYDIYGNVSNVKIGTQSLAQYSYNNTDQLGNILYGNGDKINYTYNDKGNITSISTQKQDEEIDSLIEYEYTYNDNGKLLSYVDNVNGTVTTYTDTGYTITIPSTDENTEDTVIYSTVTSNDTNESTINLFGHEFNSKKNPDFYDIETGQTNSSNKYTLPSVVSGYTCIGESLTVTDYFGRDISSMFKLNTECDLPDADENIKQYDYYVNNSYTYKNLDENTTTNLVESFTSTVGINYNWTDEESAKFQEQLANGEITQEEIDALQQEKCTAVSTLTTSYEYDTAGRITKIYHNNELSASYKYDEAGQLTEEINYNPLKVVRYTYNEGGNIASKVYYNNAQYTKETDELVYGEPTDTTSYTYDNTQWGDLLTEYNDSKITYDEIGNPSDYQGANYYGAEHKYTFKWNGRLLTEVTFKDDYGDPSEKYVYSYNADGLRTKKERYLWNKSVDDYSLYQTGEYIWENNIIKGFRITYYDANKIDSPETKYIIVLPLYNEKQELIGINYKAHDITINSSVNKTQDYESILYFTKDAQGNIISFIDAINDYKVFYQYDAHGKGRIIIPSEEARINAMPEDTVLQQIGKGLSYAGLVAVYSIYKEIVPFSYRGYFYDGETGLYYNQSRYYSGEWGRFINADDPNILTLTTRNISGANLFMYCNNDPVQNTDFYGYLAKRWYNKVSNVSKAIDIAIIAISCGKSLVGMKAIKAFIKANRKKLLKTVEKELLKLIGTTASAVVPAALDVALTLIGNSIGDLIAKALDYADPWWKRGYVRNNGYILN